MELEGVEIARGELDVGNLDEKLFGPIKGRT